MKQYWKSAASALAAVAGLGLAGFAILQVVHQAHPLANRTSAAEKSSTDANNSSPTVNQPMNQVAVNPNDAHTAPPAPGENPFSVNKADNSAGGAGGASGGTASTGRRATSVGASRGASGSVVLGSGNGPFDDSVKPGYMSYMEVLVAFAKAVGMKPDFSGTSPFKDVPTSSPNWGILHAMMERHMVGPGMPDGSFGANNTFRVRDLSSLYLNYFNIRIYPSIYDPGYDQPLVWDKTVGLLNDVVGGYPTSAYRALGPGDGLCVRPQDMTNFLANVKDFERGYWIGSQGYFQLVYPIADEAGTFVPGKPPDGYQASIMKTYQIMNDILVKQSGGDVLISLPTFPMGNEWKVYVGNKVQTFSLDGGSTWQSTSNQTSTTPFSFYESDNSAAGGMPAGKAPARVLVKSPMGTELWVRLYDGQNYVADETIGWAGGVPTVTRNDVSGQGHA